MRALRAARASNTTRRSPSAMQAVTSASSVRPVRSVTRASAPAAAPLLRRELLSATVALGAAVLLPRPAQAKGDVGTAAPAFELQSVTAGKDGVTSLASLLSAKLYTVLYVRLACEEPVSSFSLFATVLQRGLHVWLLAGGDALPAGAARLRDRRRTGGGREHG